MKESQYPRRRVMGSEQEYGIWSRRGENSWEFKEEGFLKNGGLLIEDCGHPEYASPEASNPLEAVLYDKCGELIVSRKVKSNCLRLFKHNRDYENNSFASHESYSLNRIGFNHLINATLPFFTTRIIFAGSGFIGEDGYELSQKAGVTTHRVSNSTTDDTKAIFNTRDESLADKKKYMRLHVVSGDANLSEPALFLKFGTTSLVLDLFEDKKLRSFKLKNSLKIFHKISKDIEFKEKYNVGGNGEMSAIEIQRVYQEAAEKSYRGRDDMTDDILNRWKFVLDNLEENPMNLDRWLDWTIKKKLIDSYMEKTGKELKNPEVKNIDLQYHDVNRKRGIFYMLQSKGLVDRVVTDEQIEHAVKYPPQDTRARARAAVHNNDSITLKALTWDHFIFKTKKKVLLEHCEKCEYDCKQFDHRLVTIMLDNPLDVYKGVENKYVDVALNLKEEEKEIYELEEIEEIMELEVPSA